jgi:hypothetical protein
MVSNLGTYLTLERKLWPGRQHLWQKTLGCFLLPHPSAGGCWRCITPLSLSCKGEGYLPHPNPLNSSGREDCSWDSEDLSWQRKGDHFLQASDAHLSQSCQDQDQ